MRFRQVSLATFGYELAPVVVSSRQLEQRLLPLYEKLRLVPGQLEALTGIRERRYWQPGTTMAAASARAARKAMAAAGIEGEQLDAVVYAGVCRDNLEPATACELAHMIGAPGHAQVYDVSNACLGVINGILQVATAIEAGSIEVGLVASAETARQIVDLTIEKMLAHPDHETFRTSLATLTGGSGAAAVIVCRADHPLARHRLTAGVLRNDVRHYELCRWGPDTGMPASAPMVMTTDAVPVLEHGVKLGVDTWNALLRDTTWADGIEQKLICHQVGQANRDSILAALGVPPERDFTTFEFLGNIGTVSLPLTAALAEERGFLEPGDPVVFAGIGSGLNCLMLALDW